MKTIAFTYTKADGSVSSRVLVVTNEPSENVSGTDISELDTTAQSEYVAAIKDAKETYLEMLAQINDDFDLKHNYRQFKPERMTNVVVL